MLVELIIVEFKNFFKYIEYDVIILVYILKGNGVRVKFFIVFMKEDCKCF